MSFSRKRKGDTSQVEENSYEAENDLYFVDRKGGGSSFKRQNTTKDDGFDASISGDLNYLNTAKARLVEHFESVEDKEMFVSNVLKEVIEKLVKLSCTRSGSETLDRLLLLASSSDLLPITQALGTNTRKMCIDQYASHVTESLIKRVFKLIIENEENNSDADEELIKLIDWAKSFCTFILNNFENFLNETYACHIVRVLIEELTGSQHFVKMIKKFLKKVTHLENCSEFMTQSQSIKFFQSFILILSKFDEKQRDKLIIFLTKEIVTFKSKTNPDYLPFLIIDQNSSILMESIVENSSPEVFDYLFQYLKKYIPDLAKHYTANFVLQKMIKSCKTSKQVECLFDELKDEFENIFQVGYCGILTSLATACAQHKTRQKKYIKAISSALRCVNKKLIFKAIAALTCEDYLRSDTIEVDFQGSLILQQLFTFKKPKTITESMLNIDSSDMVVLACHKFGSHIIDAFIKSPSVENDDKMKLTDLLKDRFVELACDKFGSRTLDNIWFNTTVEIRSQIAEELLRSMSKLRSNFFGGKLIGNYRLPMFKSNRDQWKNTQTRKYVNK